MSENATADLLGIQRKAIYNITRNGLPARLEKFAQGEKLSMFPVKVTAKNSPYLGRYINFYSVSDIELLLRVYSSASIAGTLQKNQMHIGRRSIIVQCALVRAALTGIIRESCGMRPQVLVNFQKEVRSFLDDETVILQAIFKHRNSRSASAQERDAKVADKKRQALLAQAFRFGYENALTKAEYQEIRGRGYPIHKHITRQETQQKLSQYLLLTAGQMILNKSCPRAGAEQRHREPFANAKKEVATVWGKIYKAREDVEKAKKAKEPAQNLQQNP